MMERWFRNAANGGRKRANLQPAPVCEDAGLLSRLVGPCHPWLASTCSASFLLARWLAQLSAVLQQSTQSLFSSSSAHFFFFFHFRIHRNHKPGLPRVFVVCSVSTASHVFATQARSFTRITHANACVCN